MNKIGLKAEKIKHCLLTHAHYDHIDGCKDLINLSPNMNFYAHIKDREEIEVFFTAKDFKFNINRTFKGELNELKLGKYKVKCIHVPGHTPGGMAYLTSIEEKEILFAGDICGGGIEATGGNHKKMKKSLNKLLKVNADILCDGHMNVIQPSEKLSDYIELCMKINDYLHIGFDIDPKDSMNWYNLARVSYDLKIYDNAKEACIYALKLDSDNNKAKNLLKKVDKYYPSEENIIEKYLKKIHGTDFLN